MREQHYVSRATHGGITLEVTGMVLADLRLVRECQLTQVAKPKGSAITKSFNRLRVRRVDAVHTGQLDARLQSVSTKQKYRIRAAQRAHARERLANAMTEQVMPCV